MIPPRNLEDMLNATPEIAPEDRVLDWAPSPDPRNRNYPMQATLRTAVRRRNKLWRPGPVLDQGREGACVGFAWAAEAFSTPVAVDLNRTAKVPTKDPTQFARTLYRNAQKVDEWLGEDYSGTSVNAGAKAMREFGLVREYRWCADMDDLVGAVLSKGPVVIGTPWYSDMYEAPNGILTPGGILVGGHAILAVGYRHKDPRLDGGDGVILQNSWGTSWGDGGRAVIRLDDLSELLADGEAAVAVRRSYGRS